MNLKHRCISAVVRPPRAVLPCASALSIVALGAVLIGAAAGRAATLDDGIEQYRSHLITDVDRTLASTQTLAASAAAGDLAAAKQAWIEARVGGSVPRSLPRDLCPNSTGISMPGPTA